MDAIRVVPALHGRDRTTDTKLHWVAEIGGTKREWDAEIIEQHPDHRVAWKALDHDGPSGVVTFHELDDARTRVMVQMEYEPEGGLKESVGGLVGADDRRVKGDLESFKQLIESTAAQAAPGVETSKTD